MTAALKTFIRSLSLPPEKIFAAEGNHPLLLNGENQVWFIESGHVDVFIARMGPPGKEGRRRHVARIEAGGCLFGCPAAPAENPLGFIAVGALGTTLAAVPRIAFLGWLETPAADSSREALLAPWIDGLTGGLTPGLPPRACEQLSAGTETNVSPDQGLRIPKAGWIRSRSVSLSWLGVPLAPSTEREAFPLSRNAWLESKGEGTITVLPLEQAIPAATCSSALDEFFAKGLELGLLLIAKDQERMSIRRDRRGTEIGLIEREAQEFIQGRIESDADFREAQGPAVEPLLAAVRMICKTLGMTVPSLQPSPAGQTLDASRLNEIAGHSRFRYRRVLLSGTWWEKECGPLLAAIEETREPVALLPSGGNRYRLIAPGSGDGKWVDESVAAKLTPFGFEFYRSFPLNPLTFWETFKFGLQGTGTDLTQIFMMTLLTSALSMLTPVITGIVFDRAIPESDHWLLLEGFLCLVVTTLVTVMWQFAQVFPQLRAESRFSQVVQAGVIDRLLNLPTAFFRGFSAGDLGTRAISINAIRQELGANALMGLQSLVSVIVQVAMMFWYSSSLAWWVILLGFVNIFVMIGISVVSMRLLRERSGLTGKQSSFVLQTILGISKLKVAAAEPRAFQSWKGIFGREKTLAYQAGLWQNVLATFHAIFPVLASGLIFYHGAALLRDPSGVKLSLGQFLAFNSASGIFVGSLLAVAQSFLSYVRVYPDIERMTPLLTAIPEIREMKSDPGELSGHVEMSRITFRYTQDGPLILNDVSFFAKPGEFLALVGASGSGKSTLFRLLLGFEKPESGSIQFDSHDLGDLDIASVRRQIGVVLQSGRLSAGSIFQLIAGDGHFTLDDAWAAAEQAGFRQDIEEMPMQMHTVIGDGGVTLSGGQRQRLLIARALIKKPRLILFDEATSALDNRTQEIVSESLAKMRATRLVIAHRLSTIQGADRIVVLQMGKVAEVGTFAELMSKNGLFANLAKRQLA